MSGTVDLYNNAYGHYEAEVYRLVRASTYGEDLGQTGWTTTQESEEIPQRLQLSSTSNVLEIGCGSGRYALQIAGHLGCRIVGLDINAAGVENANHLAASQNLSSQVRFQVADVSQPLAFNDAAFDAVFSNDVLCHVRGRMALLREVFRVLKPGGRFLFSDALVIGGMISHEEVAARSAIGYYLFSAPGENERLLRDAGFARIEVLDITASAAEISERWHNAREKHGEALAAIEGRVNFEGLQKFLATVEKLSRERRLLRLLYVNERPGS
ncbi:MAG: methyltransferase domain-containing protein [Candidatus Acidiferrales bacterium]